MKRKIAMVLAAGLVCMSLSGCNGARNTQKEVTVILKNNTAPFFLSMADGAKQGERTLD